MSFSERKRYILIVVIFLLGIGAFSFFTTGRNAEVKSAEAERLVKNTSMSNTPTLAPSSTLSVKHSLTSTPTPSIQLNEDIMIAPQTASVSTTDSHQTSSDQPSVSQPMVPSPSTITPEVIFPTAVPPEPTSTPTIAATNTSNTVVMCSNSAFITNNAPTSCSPSPSSISTGGNTTIFTGTSVPTPTNQNGAFSEGSSSQNISQ